MIQRWFLLVLLTPSLLSCAIPARETTAVFPEVFASKPKVASAPVLTLTLSDFFPLQQASKALIYDARPYYYYKLNHIPGALSWPKADSKALILSKEAEIKAALAANKIIVIYCTGQSCGDARKVANFIAKRGYPCSVYSEGLDTWLECALPTESLE